MPNSLLPHFSLLTFHFSLFTFHFSLFTSHSSLLTSIQSFFPDIVCHGLVYQPSDALSFFDSLTYLRAANVHIPRLAWCSRIDHYLVVVLDVLIMILPVEVFPVVATHQKHKLTVGIIFRQRLQGIPGIGRLRQMHLVVGGNDTLHSFKG